MDQHQYGIDGMPVHPRPGHHDHLTGQPLDIASSTKGELGNLEKVILLVLMSGGAIALIYLIF